MAETHRADAAGVWTGRLQLEIRGCTIHQITAVACVVAAAVPAAIDVEARVVTLRGARLLCLSCIATQRPANVSRLDVTLPRHIPAAGVVEPLQWWDQPTRWVQVLF